MKSIDATAHRAVELRAADHLQRVLRAGGGGGGDRLQRALDRVRLAVEDTGSAWPVADDHATLLVDQLREDVRADARVLVERHLGRR